MPYGTDEGFTAWLAGQGLSLPVGAPAVAVLRQIGSSYVDAAYGARLACSRKTGGFTQELQWPRTSHIIGGEPVPDDFIPKAWIEASYRAGYLTAVSPGWATTGSDANRVTRKEQVDVISREFFAPGEFPGASSAPGMASDSIVNGLVLPWLCSGVRRMDALFRVI